VATSFPKIVRKIVGELAALETKNLDAVPMSSFKQLHYIVNVTNSGNTKVFTVSIKITPRAGQVDFDIYSKYGNALISLNPKVVTGQFQFEFVNGEAEVMGVTLARTLI
jgi:hypothetical protein